MEVHYKSLITSSKLICLMDYSNLLKQLSINAVFWTGIAAIIITAVRADYYFALFFIGLVVLNVVILLTVEKLAPGAIKLDKETSSTNEFSFRIKPVKYPKVLDEEKREYLPEFIHLDITRNKQLIFGGDLARNVLKQLRDNLDQALMVQDAKATIVGEKKVVKKIKIKTNEKK